jgi:hypothetical protein
VVRALGRLAITARLLCRPTFNNQLFVQPLFLFYFIWGCKLATFELDRIFTLFASCLFCHVSCPFLFSFHHWPHTSLCNLMFISSCIPIKYNPLRYILSSPSLSKSDILILYVLLDYLTGKCLLVEIKGFSFNIVCTKYWMNWPSLSFLFFM